MNVTGIDHKVKAIKGALESGNVVNIRVRHVLGSYRVKEIIWRDSWSSINLKVSQSDWSGSVIIELSDIVMVEVLDHA